MTFYVKVEKLPFLKCISSCSIGQPTEWNMDYKSSGSLQSLYWIRCPFF